MDSDKQAWLQEPQANRGGSNQGLKMPQPLYACAPLIGEQGDLPEPRHADASSTGEQVMLAKRLRPWSREPARRAKRASNGDDPNPGVTIPEPRQGYILLASNQVESIKRLGPETNGPTRQLQPRPDQDVAMPIPVPVHTDAPSASEGRGLPRHIESRTSEAAREVRRSPDQDVAMPRPQHPRAPESLHVSASLSAEQTELSRDIGRWASETIRRTLDRDVSETIRRSLDRDVITTRSRNARAPERLHAYAPSTSEQREASRRIGTWTSEFTRKIGLDPHQDVAMPTQHTYPPLTNEHAGLTNHGGQRTRGPVKEVGHIRDQDVAMPEARHARAPSNEQRELIKRVGPWTKHPARGIDHADRADRDVVVPKPQYACVSSTSQLRKPATLTDTKTISDTRTRPNNPPLSRRGNRTDQDQGQTNLHSRERRLPGREVGFYHMKSNDRGRDFFAETKDLTREQTGRAIRRLLN